MKNCPVCNRVLVKKSDQSLTCMFCGWKGKSNQQELKTPEKNAPVAEKKPEIPVKIETNPENIAKQVLQEENSKLPQYVLIGAIFITFMGFLSNQMFQKSDQPSVSTESSPVSSESLQPSDTPSDAPSPAANTASPSTTPNAQEGAVTTTSPSPLPTPTGSTLASPEASSAPLLASPPAAESSNGESPDPMSTGSPGEMPAAASSPAASPSALPTASASP